MTLAAQWYELVVKFLYSNISSYGDYKGPPNLPLD